MDDRERVLMNIAVDTAGCVHDQMERLKVGWSLRFSFGHPAPQFIPLELAEKLGCPVAPGDIVRCETNPNHAWGISEFVEKRGPSDYLLRLIGGSRECNMGNERLSVLRFMDPSRLYTSTKRRVYVWASRLAFQKRYNPDADYFKRCGGVQFDGPTLVIWCRTHVWVSAIPKKAEDGTELYVQPKKFTLPWSPKTKLKDIVAAMRQQGFATEFVYAPTKPTDGQEGYFTVTRDDLVGHLKSAGFGLKEGVATP